MVDLNVSQQSNQEFKSSVEQFQQAPVSVNTGTSEKVGLQKTEDTIGTVESRVTDVREKLVKLQNLLDGDHPPSNLSNPQLEQEVQQSAQALSDGVGKFLNSGMRVALMEMTLDAAKNMSRAGLIESKVAVKMERAAAENTQESLEMRLDAAAEQRNAAMVRGVTQMAAGAVSVAGGAAGLHQSTKAMSAPADKITAYTSRAQALSTIASGISEITKGVGEVVAAQMDYEAKTLEAYAQAKDSATRSMEGAADQAHKAKDELNKALDQILQLADQLLSKLTEATKFA